METLRGAHPEYGQLASISNSSPFSHIRLEYAAMQIAGFPVDIRQGPALKSGGSQAIVGIFTDSLESAERMRRLVDHTDATPSRVLLDLIENADDYIILWALKGRLIASTQPTARERAIADLDPGVLGSAFLTAFHRRIEYLREKGYKDNHTPDEVESFVAEGERAVPLEEEGLVGMLLGDIRKFLREHPEFGPLTGPSSATFQH